MIVRIPTQPLTAEKAAQVAMLLRVLGAVFVIAGMVVGLDLGGLSTAGGLNDGSEDSIHQIFGGLLALVGLIDFFVLPVFFKKLADKNAQTL